MSHLEVRDLPAETPSGSDLGGSRVWSGDPHPSESTCERLTVSSHRDYFQGLPSGRAEAPRGSRMQHAAALLARPGPTSLSALAFCKQLLGTGSSPAWRISLGLLSRAVQLAAHTGTPLLYMVSNTPRIQIPCLAYLFTNTQSLSTRRLL